MRHRHGAAGAGLALIVPASFDGNQVRRGRHTLHLDGDAIVASGRPDATRIDLSDRDVTLLPGLIDAHVHLAISHTDLAEQHLPHALHALRMASNARRQLRAGVTTVRDLGARDGLDLQLREAFAQGLALGPRYQVSGTPLVAVAGHAAFMGRPVADAAAARREAAALIEQGVDWLKLMVTGGLSTADAGPDAQQLPGEVIAAVVEVAHAAGVRVAAHAVAGPGVRAAVEAGVDTLEHGYWLDDATIAAMRERGTVLVPTRTVVRLVAEGVTMDGVRPPPRVQETARRAEAVHADTVRRAFEAGVTIVAGTDYGHGTLPLEVALLAATGMGPLAALRAATSDAARALRRPDLGTLTPGARADLLVVRGDPTREASALREPLLVIQRGRVLLAHPDLGVPVRGALELDDDAA